MTKQEKIIVSAYTGVLMCDFDDVHEYIQKKFGRPVFAHELANKDIQKEVKGKSHEEFLEICNREEPEKKWIPCSERLPEENTPVLLGVRFKDDFKYFVTARMDYNYWTGLGRDIRGELAWMPLPEPYKEGGADE